MVGCETFIKYRKKGKRVEESNHFLVNNTLRPTFNSFILLNTRTVPVVTLSGWYRYLSLRIYNLTTLTQKRLLRKELGT
jgi:hypothetical protein